MPTFEQFCKDNNISGDVKEEFLEYILEGDILDEDDVRNGEDLDEGDLKMDLDNFKEDNPSSFGDSDEDEDEDDDED
jgi:hypothetical protein